MNNNTKSPVGLIMLGASQRLLIAAAVIACLWGLFFWATSSPGAL